MHMHGFFEFANDPVRCFVAGGPLTVEAGVAFSLPEERPRFVPGFVRGDGELLRF